MNEIILAKPQSKQPDSKPQSFNDSKSNDFKDELDSARQEKRTCGTGTSNHQPKTDKKEEVSPDVEANSENQTEPTGHNIVKEDTVNPNQKQKLLDSSASLLAVQLATHNQPASQEVSPETTLVIDNAQASGKEGLKAILANKGASQVAATVNATLEPVKKDIKVTNSKDSDKTKTVAIDMVNDADNTSQPRAHKINLLSNLQNAQNEAFKQDSSSPAKAPEITQPTQLGKTTLEGAVGSSQELQKTETSINERTHILDKKWAKNIAAKIAVNTANGMQNIRARINPASMGPIEIQISKTDDVMNISMIVSSASTKELLDSNQSKILQSLKDAGLDVGGFDINQQNQQQDDSQESKKSNNQTIDGYPETDPGDESDGIEESLNLIDSYA